MDSTTFRPGLSNTSTAGMENCFFIFHGQFLDLSVLSLVSNESHFPSAPPLPFHLNIGEFDFWTIQSEKIRDSINFVTSEDEFINCLLLDSSTIIYFQVIKITVWKKLWVSSIDRFLNGTLISFFYGVPWTPSSLVSKRVEKCNNNASKSQNFGMKHE